MGTLGNQYFYIVLLIFVLILIIVTIANSVYFSDVYNKGSENLSSQQSQQLIILNVITCILVFFTLGSLGYMLFSRSKIEEKVDETKEILSKEETLMDNKLTDLERVHDEQERMKKTKASMIKLAKEIRKPQIELTRQNSELKRNVKLLSRQLGEMSSSIVDLQRTNSQLVDEKEKILTELTPKIKVIDEIDEDENVRRDVIVSEMSNTSLFNDGMSDISDEDEVDQSDVESLTSRSETGKINNRLAETYLSVPTTEHHEDIDLIRKSKEMVLESGLTQISASNNTTVHSAGEPSYNYGFNVSKPAQPSSRLYESFTPKLNITPSIITESDKPSVSTNLLKQVGTQSSSVYKPFQSSFLKTPERV